MLRATDISQSFGDEATLRNLSLTVEPGEVVAVIGPSGVGKTTLLRVLGLSSEPDDGSVAVGGTDAWAVPESERLALRRRVGTVFQEPGLFDTTVARNVAYGLWVRRSWADRLRRYVPMAGQSSPEDAVTGSLDVVGMADRLDEPVSALSGGEAQRVSFARALAYEPDILLLDEPTSDLDPRNTAVIEEAVAAARDRGIGVVVATHDMHQAERVADRVAVLLDERFTELAPTQKIFEDPASDRTRKFISGDLVY